MGGYSYLSMTMTTAVRWLIVVPVSLGLGWIMSYFHVPAAWILAAIIGAGAMALLTREELEVNRHFYQFSRGIIGILAAVPLVGVPLGDLIRLLPPGLAVAAVSIAVTFVAGWALARSRPEIDQATGVMSMLAGGASMMPAIAQDVGADVRYVSLTQYLRLLTVSATLPLVAGLLTSPAGAGAAAAGREQDSWWMIGAVILVALLGDPIARLLRIPVPSVFGPLLLTVAISLLLPEGYTMAPPAALQILSFLAIGWVCGGMLSVPTLKVFSRQLPMTFMFIFLMMGACALVAWPPTAWLDITYFEAYLATSPGALETVLALGAEGGAGPEVIAIQLVRMVMVLLVAGWLPQILRLFTRRGDDR